MSVHFECRTVMPMSIREAFDRSRSVDLHVGSMATSRERAVAGVTSGLLDDGDEVTWAARHFGIPFRMTSLVSEVTAPTRFVDRQVRGPFQYFHHEHLFEKYENHTVMRDRVEFSAGFGVLGLIVERLVLARYMQRLITHRNDFLAQP
jgi:ligand-binding SRPBCC domain-containing protein